MPAIPEVSAADLLERATHRLVRTVDAMTDDAWAGPSLLPGWTRGHVVAHLTLNAEALTAALEAVHEGRVTPMYASQDARDADIAGLGERPSSEVRDRFLASTTVVGESIHRLAQNLQDATFPRTTGSTRTVRAGDVAAMRLRETEIHHVDLALDFTTADWSPEFVILLLDARAVSAAPERGFTAYAEDLDRRWEFGSTGGPTVSGPGVALAWWATGRGTGEGLTSDDGTVPQMEPW